MCGRTPSTDSRVSEKTPLGKRRRADGRRRLGEAGFTLIELLVVMVIIALLMGMILPAFGRVREEARKTQCRSNLRQIGFALQMYAGDVGGYFPAIYGWGEGNGITTLDQDVQSAFLHLLNTNVAGGTPEKPAIPTGPGLLLAGGYLTPKGASVLNCPHRRYEEGVGPSRRDGFTFDGNEPFYTSGGKVWISDYDEVNNFTKHAPNSHQASSGEPMCALQAGSGKSDRQNQPCCLLTSYTMRVVLDGRRFGSIKLDNFQQKTVVCDTLAGWALGGGSGGTAPKRYIQNHDANWNVLFADGAVKTFADPTHLISEVQKIGTETDGGDSETAEGRGPSGTYYEKTVFSVYFDPLYAQD